MAAPDKFDSPGAAAGTGREAKGMRMGGAEMAGKTCLITGATSGIGAATALALAGRGATVIGVGRNPQRCERSASHIWRLIGNTQVRFLQADLSVQDEIRRLAGQIKESYPRLDLLINNAGARFATRLVTADGYEMTFALNHLAYFLLTNLLLDKLKDSRHGRIVNVSSGAHHGVPGIDFADLQGERAYSGKHAYAQSKLANLLFTYELDRRLAGSAATVNAVNPGNVLTGFCKNNGWIGWARHIFGSLRSGELVGPQEGAKGSIYLASSPEVDRISGRYFFGNEAVESSRASYDTEAAKRLWLVSAELTKLCCG